MGSSSPLLGLSTAGLPCLALPPHQCLWKPRLGHALHEMTLPSAFGEGNSSTDTETQGEALWRAAYNYKEKNFKYLRQDQKS